MKNKLLYILGEASVKTHMKYNVEFLKSLSQDVELYIILEKGSNESFEKDWGEKSEAFFSPATKVIFLKTSNPIIRIIKILIHLVNANFKGFKKVYVHYSFVGAILASISCPKMEVYYWNCGIPWQYKRPFFQEIYESFAYKVVSHFVTGTQSLVDSYAKFYNFKSEKGIVIPNWIDIEKVNSISQKLNKENLKKELNIHSQKVLFFNQRLAERKGAHYLTKILENINSDFVCIITNDGPYKTKLIEELKQNKLFEKVRILGRVENKKVIEIMNITDLYLLPSEEEGMSHSLMEAMATSTSAVSFSVGGTYDMYPKNFKHFCVEEKNIDMFIDKVNILLSEEDLRNNLGLELFNKVKDYDKNIILNLFVEKIIN